jgi:hypothetical protein
MPETQTVHIAVTLHIGNSPKPAPSTWVVVELLQLLLDSERQLRKSAWIC